MGVGKGRSKRINVILSPKKRQLIDSNKLLNELIIGGDPAKSIGALASDVFITKNLVDIYDDLDNAVKVLGGEVVLVVDPEDVNDLNDNALNYYQNSTAWASFDHSSKAVSVFVDKIRNDILLMNASLTNEQVEQLKQLMIISSMAHEIGHSLLKRREANTDEIGAELFSYKLINRISKENEILKSFSFTYIKGYLEKEYEYKKKEDVLKEFVEINNDVNDAVRRINSLIN